VTEVEYGDGAKTTTAFTYDDLRRLRNLTTYRAKPPAWPATPSLDEKYSQQLLLQDEQFGYDRVGNPVAIKDWRVAEEWPDGAKPVTRKMQYDDLYRLVQIDYQYPGGGDGWVDPYLAENKPTPPSSQGPAQARPAPRADFTGALRPQRQSWQYDWLGNTKESDDDAHAFYDRSLGTVANDGYQLKAATNAGIGGSRTGSLSATYDAAGNLATLTLSRAGACVPAGKCADQRFEYLWDEVGRLVRARRWDSPNWHTVPPDADLEYAYDASDSRVRKTVVGATESRHSLYVFGSLELRLASYDSTGQRYDVSAATEVPYLFAHGVRLARVVHTAAPDFTTPSVRVFLELGDHLGTTAVVLDRASGELVERSTAYTYGAVESDLRTERWDEFREEHRFTGKEDDVEVGLIYFGARYLNPLLGRWISTDPLAVHAPGKADPNLYAYVSGRTFADYDPDGLQAVPVPALRPAPPLRPGAWSNPRWRATLGLPIAQPQMTFGLGAPRVEPTVPIVIASYRGPRGGQQPHQRIMVSGVQWHLPAGVQRPPSRDPVGDRLQAYVWQAQREFPGFHGFSPEQKRFVREQWGTGTEQGRAFAVAAFRMFRGSWIHARAQDLAKTDPATRGLEWAKSGVRGPDVTAATPEPSLSVRAAECSPGRVHYEITTSAEGTLRSHDTRPGMTDKVVRYLTYEPAPNPNPKEWSPPEPNMTSAATGRPANVEK
jgi:RHS repeat-associated protein